MKKVNHIGLVLDKSGSMASLKDEALSGLNEELCTIEEQMEETGQRTTVTFTPFSTKVSEPRMLYFEERILEEEYKCSGWTALADGIAETIKALQEIEVKENEDVSYLVTVVTDGKENASKNNTLRDIGVMIKTLEALGNWTFVFMGCDKNILEVAKVLNIQSSNTTSFTTSDYQNTVTEVKTAGIKNFYTSRDAGQKQLGNFCDG